MQWEPCRTPLLFASGVVAVAVALVAAVLAAIVDIYSLPAVENEAVVGFYWRFLTALGWLVVAGAAVSGMLALLRGYTPRAAITDWFWWKDGHKRYSVALVLAAVGIAVILWRTWEVVAVAKEGIGAAG